MADSQARDNSSRLRRNMSKLAYRSKEKVMRTIGRAEETKDEILDHYVMLINKQQLQMQKLHRDMKQYLAALKAMSISQKAFYDSLYEIYDDDWAGKDVIASCSQRNQLLHDDIFARFQAEVTDTLQNHLTEYHECKLKVEKRSRKLVDYDAARRTLQSLEASRKPDVTKLERAKEHVRITQEKYDELNSHLHEQLPTLYDSRLPVCVNTFSSICESEKVFSNEIAEMRSKLNNVLLSLKSAFDGGQYHIQRMKPPLDNGRVGATASSSEGTPGTDNSSPARIVTSSLTMSSQSPARSKKEGSLPPRSPNDATRSPGSDPSSHEYVNLQVGSMPDVVRPVTEEEEQSLPSKGRNDVNKNNQSTLPIEDELYLSPNVTKNREEISYIMANDPALSSRKSAGSSRHKVTKPKPSPRSQVFRNPLETKDTRPPIPKPLPRTLSAPTTERPLHLKKSNPSLQGNWRSHKNQYTDVHLRPHRNPSSSSLQHRPEKPRPVSMYVPAASGEFEEDDSDKLKSKDDGSGSADVKKLDNRRVVESDTAAENVKKSDSETSPKPHKGLLGFLGLRRQSKKAASAKLSTSTARDADINMEDVKPSSKVDHPVATAAGATAISNEGNENIGEESQKIQINDEAGAVEIEKAQNMADRTNSEETASKREDKEFTVETGNSPQTAEFKEIEKSSPAIHVEVAASSPKIVEQASVLKNDYSLQQSSRTAVDSDSGSDGNYEDMDSAFAQYGQSSSLREYKGDDRQMADESSKDLSDKQQERQHYDTDDDSMKHEQREAIEVDAVIRRLSLENDPVYSAAVEVSSKTQETESGVEPVDLFPDSFAGVGNNTTPLDDAFTSPHSVNQSADESGFGKDLFGSEPFECIIDDSQQNCTPEDTSSETQVNSESGYVPSQTEETSNVDPFPVIQSPSPFDGVGHEEFFGPDDSYDEKKTGVFVPGKMHDGANKSMEDAQFENIEHSQEEHSETLNNVEEPKHVPGRSVEQQLNPLQTTNNTISSTEAVKAQSVTQVNNISETDQAPGADDYEDMNFSASMDHYENVSFPSKNIETSIRPLEVNLSDDENENDDSEEKPDILSGEVKFSTNVEKKESEKDENKYEFALESQLPANSPTANGVDNAVAQPIYEEPPNEEDLPSFKKKQLDDRPPEPVPKSPTKSVDSRRYLDLPPNYLFSVQALYQYRSTDEDELSFDKGEIIHIMQHPDPEEQDDGWQMGIRQKDWEDKSDLESSMGVFPENFTKRIQL